MLAKPENGDGEALDLLHRAFSHGSARAAEMLAEIYRNGELGSAKDPAESDPIRLRSDQAFDRRIRRRTTEIRFTKSRPASCSPKWRSTQAVDVNGHPLLKPDEMERLQNFYGTIDSATRRVKFRSFQVPLTCGTWQHEADLGLGLGPPKSPRSRNFAARRQTGCYDDDTLRHTLIAASRRRARTKWRSPTSSKKQSPRREPQEDARRGRRN